MSQQGDSAAHGHGGARCVYCMLVVCLFVCVCVYIETHKKCVIIGDDYFIEGYQDCVLLIYLILFACLCVTVYMSDYACVFYTRTVYSLGLVNYHCDRKMRMCKVLFSQTLFLLNPVCCCRYLSYVGT